MADDTSNTSVEKDTSKLDFPAQDEEVTNSFEIEEALVQEWTQHKEDLAHLATETIEIEAPDHAQTPQASIGSKRTPKRTFTPAFKLEVIKKAEEGTNKAAAREFNVEDKMVREWRKQKEKLEALPPHKLRHKMGSSGLRPLLPEMEKTLVEWIQTQPKRPTNVQIQARALELNAGQAAGFKASRGWLDKFMHRHNLHLSRMSNDGISMAAPVMTMDVDSVISQIVPGEGEAINIQEACLEVANTEETVTKRRKFTPPFKLNVIELAEKTSNRQAAREYNVDERVIRGWRSNKEQLKSLPQDMSQLTELPSGSPALSPDATVSSTPEQSTPTKKRKYDVAFKLKAVEYAEKVSNRGAGRHFNVDEKRVREWRKQKELLSTLPPGKMRVGKSGCHPLLPDLEKDLVSWIKESPVKPTHSKIQEKALELHGNNDPPFKASRGWLEKFLNRHNFGEEKESVLIEAPPPVASSEDINDVDIQACLNLAKTIQESVKQGGDESALLIAKSIEETVKRSIAESLAKNAHRNIELDQSQIQSIAQTLMETVGETVAQTLEAAQVESIAQTLAETMESNQEHDLAGSIMETVEESIAEVTTEEMAAEETAVPKLTD